MWYKILFVRKLHLSLHNNKYYWEGDYTFLNSDSFGLCLIFRKPKTMKRFLFIALAVFGSASMTQAQDESENITEIIDDLTAKWDQEALNLGKYDGLAEYCKNRSYRVEMVRLLNKIHHYDTVLYQTVKAKYDENSDNEAKATLADIEHVEEKYTTKNFLDFLHQECNKFNDVEKNYGSKGGSKYIKQTEALEKEAGKYIEVITQRIDLIDEHVHHLTEL